MFEELEEDQPCKSREWYKMGLEKGAVLCDFKSLEGSTYGFSDADPPSSLLHNSCPMMTQVNSDKLLTELLKMVVVEHSAP